MPACQHDEEHRLRDVAGAGLSKSGQRMSAVDDARAGKAITQYDLEALQGDLGAQAQALHDARPEALEHRVRAFHQLQARLDGGGILKVEADRAAPTTLAR